MNRFISIPVVRSMLIKRSTMPSPGNVPPMEELPGAPNPADPVRRFTLPSAPLPRGPEDRHSRGYARPIPAASIGRVRLTAMTAEIRAHLLAQSAAQPDARVTVTDSAGALCVHLADEVVFVVLQDIASAIRAIQGSVDFLLHQSEEARDQVSGRRVVLMVVGTQAGGSDVDACLAELSRRYRVTFRYVAYQLGSSSFAG